MERTIKEVELMRRSEVTLIFFTSGRSWIPAPPFTWQMAGKEKGGII